jgi:hypothetical protein
MLYYCFLAPTTITIMESVNYSHAEARRKALVDEPSRSMFLLQFRNIENNGLLVYAYGENSKELWQKKFGDFELFQESVVCNSNSHQEVTMGRIKIKDEKEYAKYLAINHCRPVIIYYLNGDTTQYG